LDQLKEVKMSAAIKKAISDHNNVLNSVLEQLKQVNSKYECVDPEDLRDKYGTMNRIIEKKTNEINESKDYIKKCIKELEECNKPIAEMEILLKTKINERKDYIKKCINDLIKDLEECNKPIAEIEKVLEEISKTSNRGMVGTLQGLCKQTIKQNKIPMDEIEEMVFGFHDEKNEIKKSKKKSASRGGKRNNTKRENYIAKNGNNKSKTRRLP